MDAKIALSIDIEDWFHTPLFAGAPGSRFGSLDEFYGAYAGKYDRITAPTRRILEMLDTAGITATFFVVADVCAHYPEIVRMLRDSGHEIGCHGLNHFIACDPKTGKTVGGLDDFGHETGEAKRLLEDAFGRRVAGYRAPFAYVNGDMLRVVADLGFDYDSSVSSNSLYSKTSGLGTDVTTRPVLVPFEDGGGIWELPWSYYEAFGFRVPTSGAFFLRALGKRIVGAGIRQSLTRGDTMLYFHSLDICEDRFPVRNTNGRWYYWVNRGRPAARRVAWLLERFAGRFTSCADVYGRNSGSGSAD